MNFRLVHVYKKTERKLVQWSFENNVIKGIFGMSHKFHCCSKHLSKCQTSHMRFVQDSGEALNTLVTSPLTAEWLFQSRLACNQWQKVTHTPPTRTLTADWYTTHSHMHMHRDRSMYTTLHNQSHTYILIQNMHAYTKTHTHSWINTLGHNPRDEPYGTSIGSSITQSQKMAGSLRVCVCDSFSLVCIARQLI